MKKTIEAEAKPTTRDPFPDGAEFAPITVREDIQLETLPVNKDESVALDRIVATIKWVFLFFPGATAIHFVMMGLALLFFYSDWAPEPLIGSLGIGIVATFMVMLGLGKMRDLKYLRVVGAIFASGALASIIYSILIVFIPGDFFGWFTLLTLPLTVLMGLLVKRMVDKDAIGQERQPE